MIENDEIDNQNNMGNANDIAPAMAGQYTST